MANKSKSTACPVPASGMSVLYLSKLQSLNLRDLQPGIGRRDEFGARFAFICAVLEMDRLSRKRGSPKVEVIEDDDDDYDEEVEEGNDGEGEEEADKENDPD
ncbi:hypothetical protein WISP_88019 [Willisornis vidua]|uniref:Uncharacterized protein n=1 Tax=Willisornis vidua TaxID=1566151 RepID=A0ABQ9D7V4_9PASS|nr:hypothetical protein WISP_88019 [Willisornis vidua]